MAIVEYPQLSEISEDIRPVLHPRFQLLVEGVSEITFANIYLFRDNHNYRISKLPGELFVIVGRDDDMPFFMLPFGLPDEEVLKQLFNKYRTMKAATESQAQRLNDKTPWPH